MYVDRFETEAVDVSVLNPMPNLQFQWFCFLLNTKGYAADIINCPFDSDGSEQRLSSDLSIAGSSLNPIDEPFNFTLAVTLPGSNLNATCSIKV